MEIKLPEKNTETVLVALRNLSTKTLNCVLCVQLKKRCQVSSGFEQPVNESNVFWASNILKTWPDSVKCELIRGHQTVGFY